MFPTPMVFGDFENDTTFNISDDSCLPGFDFHQFTHYSVIPATLIIGMLAFLEHRRSHVDICGGRPALIVPLHFLDGYEDRFGYAAGFGAITNLIISLFTNANVYPFSVPIWAAALLIQLSALEYSVICFPLFACIATRHKLVGAITLFLYSTLWFLATVVYRLQVECQYSVQGANKGYKVQLILSQAPIFFCYAYLMLRSIHSIYMCFHKQKYVLEENTDVIHPHQALYVRVLLDAKNYSSDTTKPDEIWYKRWYRKIHKPVCGFKYPVRIVATVFVVISISYQFIAYLLMLGFQALYYVAKMDDKSSLHMTVLNGTLTVLNPTIVNVFIGVYFLSLLLVTLMACTNMYLFLTTYRLDILNMFKGVHSFAVDKTKPTYFIMAENLRFPGYQVAYMLWGMIILMIVVMILGFGLSYVIFLLAVNNILVDALSYLAQVLSVPATMILLFYLQVLVSRFLLLQPKVKDTDTAPPLNVNNRKFYEDFNYYAFFGNLGIGVVSCFFRILQGSVLGVLLVGRLERTIFMAGWEHRDKGYQAYIGMLRMENAHNHPILRVFSGLMWEVAFKKRHLAAATQDNQGTSRKYRTFPSIESTAPSSRNLHSLADDSSSLCSFENVPVSRNNIHRRRWWVAYTLINNPDLCQKRKKWLFEIPTDGFEFGAGDESVRNRGSRNEAYV
ncbi:stimulated by retinoic acid gene 6 protein-like isoform X2 [Gigantopelta aegis]|uniref:stimulated by retinoic acid gene 6 protein-like isoform X2 n=1 Tax=Gigantopelta aegis TaxID=1735272 RepID=UPI001B88A95C|nr:stimulated by retinoic acid gene 6 protein-like isoform X2 [Gigantopelta aegis]